MTRVYDTFPMRDELDLLQCRLEELESVVDCFVIVEATVTHSGEPKPLHFAEHRKRFARWLSKIRYYTLGEDQLPAGAWGRENAQRDHCRVGLHDAPSDALVLHGDLDEIPSRAAIREVLACPEPHAFEMNVHHFAVDWRDPQCDVGTIAARFSDIDGFHAMCVRRRGMPRITNGGWHFSKLGTVAHQVNHVRWGCHLADSQGDGSFDTIASGRAYRDGWQAGVKLIPVDVDDSWPAFIRERRCPDSWFRPREVLR